MNKKVQLRYERNLNHTYLVYEGEIQEQTYEMQMILNNTIYGLLPCRFDKVDGVGRLYYEISSKQSLVNAFEKKKIGYNLLKQLFASIRQVFDKLEEYLLPEEYVLLDPEYIFLEPELHIFYFCFAPIGEVSGGIHGLLEFLLECIDYSDEKAVAAAYEWYRKEGEENYSFSAIYQQVFSMSPEGDCSPETASLEVGTQHEMQQVMQHEMQQAMQQEEEQMLDNEEEKFIETSTGLHNANIIRLCLIPAVGGLLLVLCIYIGILQSAGSILAGAGGVLVVSGIKIYMQLRPDKEEMEYIWEEDVPETVFSQEKELSPAYMEISDEDIPHMQVWNRQEQYTETAFKDMKVKDTKLQEQNSVQTYGATIFMRNEQIEEGRRLKSVDGRFPLLKLELFPYIIGKLSGAVDGIVEDQTVSRIHCKIEYEEGDYYIKDLNSTNGTIVNGEVVGDDERMKIHTGDEIQIGQAVYVFE